MIDSAQPLLVVDDDPVSRHVLSSALGESDIPHVVCESGSAALDWLASNRPRLVLLDLMMPEPDGYVILSQLRQKAEFADVPVVVLTALDAEHEVARAFEAGADDFLRKPFGAQELIARIQGQLRLRDYLHQSQQREKDSHVLLELTRALSSTLDLRTILHTVVQRVAQVMQVDRCSIVLVRDGGAIGHVIAASDDHKVRDLPLALDKYPEIREVLATGEHLVIEDASTHPLFEMLRRESAPHDYSSLAILPIHFENRPMGVLFLRSRTPASFHGHALFLARTIANTTAIALRNARILQSLRAERAESNEARFEAERRLRVTERYAEYFETAAESIVALSHEGVVLFSNPSACTLLGFERTELVGKTVGSFVQGVDDQWLVSARQSLAEGGMSHTRDLVVLTKGGQLRTVSTSICELRDEQALVITFRDVTRQRSMEAELSSTKSFLERVIESSVDAIISADLRGNVLLFNRAAERCYGYRATEVVGKLNVGALYPGDTAREIMALIRENNGRIDGHQVTVLGKQGQRIPVSLSASLIYDDGVVVGSVGIFKDLRERIRMQTRLVAAQEELKARDKQALIAELAGAAAHELNQPLTSVMGYAELLKRRIEHETPAYSACEVIVSEAERMAEIVRKIGKITRYETKSYVGRAKILDLDKASGDRGPSSIPPSGGRGGSVDGQS